jgi:hypothetical protein
VVVAEGRRHPACQCRGPHPRHEPVGLEYWIVGLTCGFGYPWWIMLQFDTHW